MEMNMEYVRNLHSNYVRMALEEKPEEKKYQYCILSRGGIKGLLPCSLRYLDGAAFLYYDITSKQNLTQLYQRGSIGRDWVLDFMESIRHLQLELGRFLLQEDNILWEPQSIFEELEDHVFSFLYVPYYAGENQFLKLLGFLVEKVDYEDEVLVETIYKMYEQFEKNGSVYLQEQIFQDVKVLEGAEKKKGKQILKAEEPEGQATALAPRTIEQDALWESVEEAGVEKTMLEKTTSEKGSMAQGDAIPSKKIFGIFEGRKGKKQKEQEKREEYRESFQRSLDGYAVAEDSQYEEEYGRTTFLMEKPDRRETAYRLYFSDGRKASDLDGGNLLIGKYKEKVDLYLEDNSVSRMHARILKDQNQYYLEDENSTNGTYRGKTRLQPYERKRLEPGDEIRIGNVTLYFR